MRVRSDRASRRKRISATTRTRLGSAEDSMNLIVSPVAVFVSVWQSTLYTLPTAGAGIDHGALLGGRNRPDDPDPVGLSTAGSTQPTCTAHLWLAATGGLRSAHRAGRLHRTGRALSCLRPRVHHMDGYRSGIDDSGLASACLRIAATP